jgi:hypothetical protein
LHTVGLFWQQGVLILSEEYQVGIATITQVERLDDFASPSR